MSDKRGLVIKLDVIVNIFLAVIEVALLKSIWNFAVIFKKNCSNLCA